MSGMIYSLYEYIWSFFKTPEIDLSSYVPLPFHPPKFEVGDPAALTYLNEHGYVVFKEVATKEEIEKSIGLFWDFCEAMCWANGVHRSIKRDSPETWHNAAWPGDKKTGIIYEGGIAQSSFMWYNRTLPKVKAAFQSIWDDEDLLTSFDGCGAFRPPTFDPQWRTDGSWYHIDQNPYSKPDRISVQGLLNLIKSHDADGGLVVVPKSTHMIRRAFAADKTLARPKGDFIRVKATPESFWHREVASLHGGQVQAECHDLLPVKLCLDAGDFVMWESTTIHCNNPVSAIEQALQQEEVKSPAALRRLVSYICMTPSKFANNLDELADQRIYAWQNGISTTHWPHEFHPSSSKSWVHIHPVGKNHVKLSPEGAKLVVGSKSAKDVFGEVPVVDFTKF